ncbi:MAG: hypothetical protein M1827_002586 [Pycnora praestabilis]|nr:MAG: hypothetical protein M1827_002586 [Pycnora praestabilis]
MEKTSSRPATILDMISWLTEKLHREGKIGFKTYTPISELTALCALSTSAVPRPFPLDLDLDSSLGGDIAEYSRETYLLRVLKQNKALMPQVCEEVDARLEKVGCDQAWLAASTVTLAMKLKKLDEVKRGMTTPPAVAAPMDPEWFINLITEIDGEGTPTESTRLYFSRKASFHDFLTMLKGWSKVSSHLMTGHEGGYTLGHGAWVYELTNSKLQRVKGAQVRKIMDKNGYWSLKQQLNEKETPSAVVWHERLHELQESRRRVALEKEQTDISTQVEDLESGEPYFKTKIDWDVVAYKGIGGSGPLARLFSEVDESAESLPDSSPMNEENFL